MANKSLISSGRKESIMNKEWTFYGKTIFMWCFVLGLSLLDAFVPQNFYKSFINEVHIFKYLEVCIILSAILGSVVCKFGWNKESKDE